MRYFIRINGILVEVRPTTEPSSLRPSLRVVTIPAGRIRRILASELIIVYQGSNRA